MKDFKHKHSEFSKPSVIYTIIFKFVEANYAVTPHTKLGICMNFIII